MFYLQALAPGYTLLNLNKNMETTIVIDNLKCGGCANTIKKNVQEFEHVTHVTVEPENERVIISYTQAIDIPAIKSKLHSLGYPEKDTAQGFDKFASNIKSYVSCAIGRLTDDETKLKES